MHPFRAKTESSSRIAKIAILIGVLLCCALTWAFASIPLRLYRNGHSADALVASLRIQFPEIPFNGTASYQSEVIYVQALGKIDQTKTSQIREFLDRQKALMRVSPEIRLMFPNNPGQDDLFIIP